MSDSASRLSTPAPTNLQRRLARLRERRILARGVTLIEILIVLAIIGLIAGGVAAVAVPQLEKSRISQTKNNLIEIHKQAEMYRADHSDCPTIGSLQRENLLSKTSDTKDPWGGAYKIVCDDDLRVMSRGKDGKEGTDDDLWMPPAQAAED